MKKEEESFGRGSDSAGAAQRHVTIWASSRLSCCHFAPLLTHRWCRVTQDAAFLFVCLVGCLKPLSTSLFCNTVCVSEFISPHYIVHVSNNKMSSSRLSAFVAWISFSMSDRTRSHMMWSWAVQESLRAQFFVLYCSPCTPMTFSAKQYHARFGSFLLILKLLVVEKESAQC